MIGDAFKILFDKFPIQVEGVNFIGGEAYAYERTTIQCDDVTMTIIAERKINDLEKEIQKAIDREEYELAAELEKHKSKRDLEGEEG